MITAHNEDLMSILRAGTVCTVVYVYSMHTVKVRLCTFDGGELCDVHLHTHLPHIMQGHPHTTRTHVHTHHTDMYTVTISSVVAHKGGKLYGQCCWS